MAQLDYVASRHGPTPLKRDRILKDLIRYHIANEPPENYWHLVSHIKNVLALTDRETFMLLTWAGIELDDRPGNNNQIVLRKEDNP